MTANKAIVVAGGAGAVLDDQGLAPLRGQLFADDRAHAPHNKRGICQSQHERPTTHVAFTDHASIRQSCLLLFVLQAIFVRLLIREAQRIDWKNVGEPLFKTFFVEQLSNASFGRDIKVVIAFRATIQVLLHLFAIDSGFAAIALNPKPFGHAALLAFAIGTIGIRRRSSAHRYESLGVWIFDV